VTAVMMGEMSLDDCDEKSGKKNDQDEVRGNGKVTSPSYGFTADIYSSRLWRRNCGSLTVWGLKLQVTRNCKIRTPLYGISDCCSALSRHVTRSPWRHLTR